VLDQALFFKLQLRVELRRIEFQTLQEPRGPREVHEKVAGDFVDVLKFTTRCLRLDLVE